MKTTETRFEWTENMVGWKLWQVKWRRANGPVQVWHFFEPDHDTAWDYAIEKIKRDFGCAVPVYILDIDEVTK